MDLGLERVTSLLEALAPNSSLSPPHHSFPIIHVAGTNGKGSICAYLSSIFQTAGLRVGRYNSPHLITPRDTIQINNQPISEDDYQYATEVVKQKDAELGLKATSFELLTATAFYWFAYGRIQTGQNNPHHGHQGMVDIAVIEVGVGGRLDATNVISSPKVCVIASIGMDHGALLGNTIEQVAFEKAGIIKPKVPVVIAPQAEGEKVYQVLLEKAISVDLESDQIVMVKAAHWINEAQEPPSPTAKTAVGHWATLEDGFKFWIPLLGDFQLENAATAIAAIRVLQKSGGESNDSLWRLKITDDAIRQGIKDTVWPGRLQWIEQPDALQEVNGRMLIDGAHNPPAAIALRTFVEGHIASLQSLSPAMPNGRPRVHWIMAFTKGKDIEEMFDILFSAPSKQGSRGPDTFSAVEFSPPEGMPWVSPIDSQEVCDRLTRQQERVHVQESDRLVIQGFGMDLDAALKWVGTERNGDDVVVLCGSLYLVADLFRLLAPQ